MKSGIHPEYHKITVSCTCGNSFETGSTIDDGILKIEVCSNCHPFYTGKQKIIDTAGKVEAFNRRFGGSLSATDKDSKK